MLSKGSSRSSLLTSVVVLTSAFLLLAVFSLNTGQATSARLSETARSVNDDTIVLAWNDLGMHCYNRDFQDLAVLPPFNTLWAQVVRRGDPPVIVTDGITVTFSFAENTYSVGKSNFWDYDELLFGVDLPPNVGLTGTGMAGEMERKVDHFVADGSPLTEFRDNDLINPYPYQLATVTVHDAQTETVLTQATVVAPVSTEMNCDDCHYDGAIEDITTGRVATNILTLHDMEHLEEYPPTSSEPLMNRRPILCASCHSSNALGTPPVAEIPSLSNAMHENHSEEVSSNLEGCYKCHPGPQTQCLRDTMYQSGMECVDCHGNMAQVGQNPDPWLLEPRCDSVACHGSGYQQDQPLYRLSQDHGGMYCPACHDSPHAIAPSVQLNDNIKFLTLQAFPGALQDCAVCHTVAPTEAGPHGLTKSQLTRTHLPLLAHD